MERGSPPSNTRKFNRKHMPKIMVQPPEKQFSKKCQLQMCYPIFMASPTASHGNFLESNSHSRTKTCQQSRTLGGSYFIYKSAPVMNPHKIICR